MYILCIYLDAVYCNAASVQNHFSSLSLPPSLVSSPAAEPTPEEGEVHRKVAMVLDRAPDILADLHGYKGAGEHIREVGNCHLSLEEGISYLLHVNARSCIH